MQVIPLGVVDVTERTGLSDYAARRRLTLPFRLIVMKFSYRVISVLLLSLPLLLVVLFWDRLPVQLPIHFGPDRQPDHFSKRQEWFVMLLVLLFFLNMVRAVILRFVGRQRNLTPKQYLSLYLLTAGFVAGTLSLVILQSLYQSPVYADWLPVLFFLSGSGFIYFAVPPVLAELPETLKEQAAFNGQMARRLAALQRLHALSRLVVIRANLLVVVLMFFANRSDRWTMGILANVLAYAFLFILTIATNRNITQ